MITQTLDRRDPVLGFTHSLVEHIAREVEQLYVLQLWAGDQHLPANVRTLSMGKERGAGRLEMLGILTRSVRTLVEREKVDVVFAHMAPLFAIAAAPVARIRRTPLVLWYAHTTADTKLRLALALCDRVVSPTPESFPLGTSRLRVVGHGVDTQQFRPIPRRTDEDVFRFLCVGRISPIKNVDVYLRAARLALDARPTSRLRFDIVGAPSRPGDDQYLQELHHLADQLNLADALEFRPAVPHAQLPERYAACDVHSNQALTPDKVVFESMACGRIPMVCNPTFRPLLGETTERCLFRPRDPMDLAARMLSWTTTDADERAAIGSRLRETIERDHSMAGLARRLRDTFEELARGDRGVLPASRPPR